MEKESEAVILRIYTGEATQHEGRPLYKYLVDLFRKEQVAGCTVLRGIDGFGKTSHVHNTSILRLSTDLPVVVEVVDREEVIERIKPLLEGVVMEGLVTEHKVKVLLYEGKKSDAK